jgi:hypothetical protein
MLCDKNKIGVSMNKATQLLEQFEKLSTAEGMQLIEESNKKALYFNVIGDAMCIMHDDGSVNIIENMGNGMITGEVISSENILKVLHHYRPFKEVFRGNVQ